MGIEEAVAVIVEWVAEAGAAEAVATGAEVAAEAAVTDAAVATAADAAIATGVEAATVDTGMSLAADVAVSDAAFGATTSELGSGVAGMTAGDVSTAYAGSLAGDAATSSTVIGGATEAGAYGTAADATLTGSSGLTVGDVFNGAKTAANAVQGVRTVSQALAPRVASNATMRGVTTPVQQFTQAAPSYQNGLAALTGAQQKAFGIADPLTPQQVAQAATPANGWMLPVMVLAILAFTYKEMPHG